MDPRLVLCITVVGSLLRCAEARPGATLPPAGTTQLSDSIEPELFGITAITANTSPAEASDSTTATALMTRNVLESTMSLLLATDDVKDESPPVIENPVEVEISVSSDMLVTRTLDAFLRGPDSVVWSNTSSSSMPPNYSTLDKNHEEGYLFVEPFQNNTNLHLLSNLSVDEMIVGNASREHETCSLTSSCVENATGHVESSTGRVKNSTEHDDIQEDMVLESRWEASEQETNSTQQLAPFDDQGPGSLKYFFDENTFLNETFNFDPAQVFESSHNQSNIRELQSHHDFHARSLGETVKTYMPIVATIKTVSNSSEIEVSRDLNWDLDANFLQITNPAANNLSNSTNEQIFAVELDGEPSHNLDNGIKFDDLVHDFHHNCSEAVTSDIELTSKPKISEEFKSSNLSLELLFLQYNVTRCNDTGSSSVNCSIADVDEPISSLPIKSSTKHFLVLSVTSLHDDQVSPYYDNHSVDTNASDDLSAVVQFQSSADVNFTEEDMSSHLNSGDAHDDGYETSIASINSTLDISTFDVASDPSNVFEMNMSNLNCSHLYDGDFINITRADLNVDVVNAQKRDSGSLLIDKTLEEDGTIDDISILEQKHVTRVNDSEITSLMLAEMNVTKELTVGFVAHVAYTLADGKSVHRVSSPDTNDNMTNISSLREHTVSEVKMYIKNVSEHIGNEAFGSAQYPSDLSSPLLPYNVTLDDEPNFPTSRYDIFTSSANTNGSNNSLFPSNL
ncbi:uncharacterized protein LOC108683287 [Hyalella azteca]|uniref:Uncharacterized protein LOC108683287 n=1 Tax=Hyalella azteca TaxID=294128 RepID=A0A8B7PPE6_HYAAZ|nr:uncharacterized protein LOC108683287 [Hyalella azteca]